MKNKKKKIGISMGIVVALLLIIGVSYAFFALTLRGDKDLTVISGTLALQYKDQNAIQLEKTYPLSDQEGMKLTPYEFRVENTGDIKALYDIILEENEENTLNSVWLKYSIKRNEEEWSTPRKISSLKLEEGLEIEPGKTDVYQLRLWIDEEVGNEVQNKSFKGRVVINSVQSNASTSDLTPPVITLNGSLSESVEQGGTYTDPGVASVSDDRDSLEISNVKVSYKYFDGESTTSVESIDTSKTGVYYIYYKIKDENGNEGRIIRCVSVYKEASNPPVITLNGKSIITIEKGGSYTELGATAKKDGEDLTDQIVVTGEVNTSSAGVYEVRYVITDEEGNTSSVVRVVNVISVSETTTTELTIDLSENPRDKIHFEGENLGKITYTSSDESIASVDSDGNVLGYTPGEVIIHITTSTGVEKEVPITVVKTVTVTYSTQKNGITAIGKTSDSCLIREKGGSCEVTLPTITVKEGYDPGFWVTDLSETSGSEVGSNIHFSENVTYYAKARDVAKPVWSLVSTSPASGTSNELTITFVGTDNSGTVFPTLTAEHIIVKVGNTFVKPSMKSLSFAVDIENGKEYTLKISGFSTSGVVAITIPDDTLQDEDGNGNVVTSFTTSVEVAETAVGSLAAKINDRNLTYASATDAEKKEMFTFTHEAGEQQEGWTEEELIDYRYIGTSPNNYVLSKDPSFLTLWRIVGIFTIEDENGKKEQRIKLVSDSSLRTSAWNSTDSGDFPTSTLQTSILGVGTRFGDRIRTINFPNMIGTTKWYLGRNFEGKYADPWSLNAMDFYELERKAFAGSSGTYAISWSGEVALIYASDYGYAASGEGCLTKALSSGDSNCVSTDWLNTSENKHTITGAYAWPIVMIRENGAFGFPGPTATAAIYPSLYLKSSVKIISGDGTQENPYQLQVDE